jgi:hypothetical protein
MTTTPATIRDIAVAYRRFAECEARGRSALYEALALGVAGDETVLRFLAELPAAKRQPNLLLAAVRHVAGLASGWQEFREAIDRHRDVIADVMRARRTQTNEPARCATLLPLLARLPQPLALIEVGAAAGLCLLPDHYAYDFDGQLIAPSAPVSGSPPLFHCSVNPKTPLPDRNIEVIWRAGLDLEPVDLEDEAQVAWLETLVWPGEGRRLGSLRAAVDAARRHPPLVRRGDLNVDLLPMVAEAPEAATLAVFHSAVLPYLTEQDREAFRQTARARLSTWIANEGAELQPRSASRLNRTAARTGDFLLSINERPIAWTDPHGARLDWI